MKFQFSIRDIIDSSVQGTHCVYVKVMVDIPAMFVSYLAANLTQVTANTLTYLGACFAAVSAFHIISGEILYAALWFYGSFLCDFMDGKIARLRQSSSHYGKKLDLAFDRLIFCSLTLSYLFYFENNGMLKEQVILIVYAMIFLTYDVLELTDSVVGYRKVLDNIGVVHTNPSVKDEVEDRTYFTSLRKLKTWVPSRVGSVGFVFILAPLTSFLIAYIVSLVAISIRLTWFLIQYFKR